MGNDRDEADPLYRSTNLERPQLLSEDQLYRALASTRRRRLLYSLREVGECTVDDLAALLVQWEGRDPGRNADEQSQLHIKLVHSDLPLLADAGVVSYNRENETVAPKPLDPLLDALISRSVDPDNAP